MALTGPGDIDQATKGFTPDQLAELEAERQKILAELDSGQALDTWQIDNLVPFDPIITFTSLADPSNYSHTEWPHLIHTLHCIQCPPGRGWVRTLLGLAYFGKAGENVSVQFMVDAADTGQGLPFGMQAWQVGGPGNQLSAGTEQAGYADFTTAMWQGTEQVGATYVDDHGNTITWTADDNTWMAAQFERLAQLFAKIHTVYGIPLVWLTLAQLQQAAADYNAGRTPTVTGFCCHEDWTASGASNTTHTDPGKAYPKDALMARVKAIASPPPPPPPAPSPSTDLLEWIMSLPGTPSNATYDTVKADFAAAAAAAVFADKVAFRSALNGKNTPNENVTFAQFLADIGNWISVIGRYEETDHAKPAPTPAPTKDTDDADDAAGDTN